MFGINCLYSLQMKLLKPLCCHQTREKSICEGEKIKIKSMPILPLSSSLAPGVGSKCSGNNDGVLLQWSSFWLDTGCFCRDIKTVRYELPQSHHNPPNTVCVFVCERKRVLVVVKSKVLSLKADSVWIFNSRFKINIIFLCIEWKEKYVAY